MPTCDANHSSLLEAASFAARAHRHQVRKDGQTPYVAHPFRVCLIVRHVFGIDDPDIPRPPPCSTTRSRTRRPTTTTWSERFGEPRSPAGVAALSKDTRLPEDEREAAYMATLAAAEPAVKIAKLADMFDNLTDIRPPVAGKTASNTGTVANVPGGTFQRHS